MGIYNLKNHVIAGVNMSAIIKCVFIFILPLFLCSYSFAQHSDENGGPKQLRAYEDSLKELGKKFVNADDELERKNANYTFIKTLVSALKIPNSFLYPFDSVKSVSIINSPDNRFRIITWPIANEDGSYRFYGTIQINTGGSLKMYPLNDYSFAIKNPEDTITDNLKWFGAMYYKIIPVYSPQALLCFAWLEREKRKINRKSYRSTFFQKMKSPYLASLLSTEMGRSEKGWYLNMPGKPHCYCDMWMIRI